MKEIISAVKNETFSFHTVKKIKEKTEVIVKKTNNPKDLLKSIDSLVFDLYELTDENRKYILNYLNTMND